MKLRRRTKPKVLSLFGIWTIHLKNTGVESGELIVKALDLFYPHMDRNNLSVYEKYKKYTQGLQHNNYPKFVELIKGMK